MGVMVARPGLGVHPQHPGRGLVMSFPRPAYSLSHGMAAVKTSFIGRLQSTMRQGINESQAWWDRRWDCVAESKNSEKVWKIACFLLPASNFILGAETAETAETGDGLSLRDRQPPPTLFASAAKTNLGRHVRHVRHSSRNLPGIRRLGLMLGPTRWQSPKCSGIYSTCTCRQNGCRLQSGSASII